MRHIELSFIDSKESLLNEIKRHFPYGVISEEGFSLKTNTEEFNFEVIDFFSDIHIALFDCTMGVDTTITIKPNQLKSLVVRFILESSIVYGDELTAIGEGLENGVSLFNTYTEQKIVIRKNRTVKWIAVHIPIEEWIAFTESKWEMLDEIVANPAPWILFENMIPKFSTLIKDIFSYRKLEVGKKGLISSKSIELTTHFFIQLFKRHSDNEKYGIPDVDLASLFAIRQLLSENIDAPPDMETLSRTFAMSSSKLRSNFKKVFGMPPYQYVLTERLNEAYRLLESSSRSLTDIALTLGFNDQSHFTKSFKKTFNCLPSSVRQ